MGLQSKVFDSIHFRSMLIYEQFMVAIINSILIISAFLKQKGAGAHAYY